MGLGLGVRPQIFCIGAVQVLLGCVILFAHFSSLSQAGMVRFRRSIQTSQAKQDERRSKPAGLRTRRNRGAGRRAADDPSGRPAAGDLTHADRLAQRQRLGWLAREAPEVVSPHGLESCATPQSPSVPPPNVSPRARGTEACVGGRPAASERRDQVSECPFRVVMESFA